MCIRMACAKRYRLYPGKFRQAGQTSKACEHWEKTNKPPPQKKKKISTNSHGFCRYGGASQTEKDFANMNEDKPLRQGLCIGTGSADMGKVHIYMDRQGLQTGRTFSILEVLPRQRKALERGQEQPLG